MPWDESEHGGFSSTKPWLPVPDTHRTASVANQEANPNSPLQRFRQFTRWRTTQPALRWGSIRFIETQEPVLAFIRTWNEHAVFVAFNLAAEDVAIRVNKVPAATQIQVPGLVNGTIVGDALRLPAYSAVFAAIR